MFELSQKRRSLPQYLNETPGSNRTEDWQCVVSDKSSRNGCRDPSKPAHPREKAKTLASVKAHSVKHSKFQPASAATAHSPVLCLAAPVVISGLSRATAIVNVHRAVAFATASDSVAPAGDCVARVLSRIEIPRSGRNTSSSTWHRELTATQGASHVKHRVAQEPRWRTSSRHLIMSQST